MSTIIQFPNKKLITPTLKVNTKDLYNLHYGRHTVKVKDSFGSIIRDDKIDNLVVTAGLNYLLEVGLTNGTAQITTWYIGMIIEQSHQNTASMTSGSPTLTVGTSVTVSTGQYVTVYGAGASGANLNTTVATGTTGTSITLSANAGTSVTNAIVTFGPTFAAADTMSSHTGWTEVPSADITQSTRPAWTPGTVSGGAIAAGTATTFNMASGLAGIVYLHGFFVASNNTLGGTAGTLFSEGEFTQGALAVQASYSVNDTYTISL